MQQEFQNTNMAHVPLAKAVATESGLVTCCKPSLEDFLTSCATRGSKELSAMELFYRHSYVNKTQSSYAETIGMQIIFVVITY